jgi:hypothetical protein
LLRTFFDGSTSKAVAALIDLQKDSLSDDELKQLDGLLKL